MTSLRSHCKIDTGYCADSVEFCPHPDALNVLVCGTYQLQKNEEGLAAHEEPTTTKQRRLGRCYVFEQIEKSAEVMEIQRFDLPAILDMKWSFSHRNSTDGPLLAIADSEGRVTFHNWSLEKKRLEQFQKLEIASPDVLCLSLDWSNRRSSITDQTQLIVSLSNGELCHVAPTSEGTYVISSSWHAHDYEPWIVAWDYWHPHIAFSGGDDCKLKGWDVRQGGSQPTFVNKRFDAGVTAIQNNPHIEHLVAVGSYDETVRIFDMRKPMQTLSEISVGGGVWRVKWHPSSARRHDILVACMHDGFKVIQPRTPLDLEDRVAGPTLLNGVEYKVTQRFDEHQSLGYGVDWSHASNAGGSTLVASCSFYDHILHTWESELY